MRFWFLCHKENLEEWSGDQMQPVSFDQEVKNWFEQVRNYLDAR